MRDAFGGVTSLVIIVVFLVLVSGYLAFNVIYTKAFKVKNKIITLFEQYEGKCGQALTNECDTKISEYVRSIGYSSELGSLTNFSDSGLSCPDGASCPEYGCSPSGYCWLKVKVTTGSDVEEKAYYKIVTRIEMDIPIINKIMSGLRFFQISGDTRTIIVAN